MPLTIHDFTAFYHELWDYPPFPWQQRLVQQIHTEGHWPAALDLPTGTGKTSALDIAVFTLALDSDPQSRVLPLRTMLVVDRRTIVDQAALRARHIADKLERAEGPVLRAVKQALSRLAGPDAATPLLPVTLRGAMPRDDLWARTATQPMLVASTVDQVGSRLLFRGYGTSKRSRSIHAGLLGHDTLLLLDEVHLSRPFQQTLAGIQRYRALSNSPVCKQRWQVVELSATRMPGGATPFTLQPEDREHPILAQRLNAAKPTQLHTVPTKGAEPKRRDALSQAMVMEVLDALEERGDRVVGVIHNRVDGALRTWRRLKAPLAERGVPLHLVTGRMRPLDRVDIERELIQCADPSRPRDGARPGVVVATQCIEAGADLDFDVLITECASFDALVQRMGRANRRGLCPDARGVVLARIDQIGPGTEDPIYGAALVATWQYLQGLESVDFGAQATLQPPVGVLPSLLPPRDEAPVLLPSHLDAWAQTNPGPFPDPDVSLFLHGLRQAPPEVSLVWRADLSQALLERHAENALSRIEIAPPGSTEAISLPLWVVRRWLDGGQAADVVDVEGVDLGQGEEPDEPTAVLSIAWRGSDSVVVSPEQIEPGDTVVVPCAYGGIEGGTFCADTHPPSPDAIQAVSESAAVFPVDHAERVQIVQRGRALLRLDFSCLQSWAPHVNWPPLPSFQAKDESDSDESDDEQVATWLQSARALADVLPGWANATLTDLSTANNRHILWGQHLDGSDRLVLRARRRTRRSSTVEVSSEDDLASFTDREITLEAHLEGVSSFTEATVVALGLPVGLAKAIVLAAEFHDVGKADPRFQALLRGGDRLMVDGGAALLAKSGHPPALARPERARLHRLSGYPIGTRHELLSVAMLDGHPLLDELAEHADLVLHLVGSHHGWCRPLAPVEPDSQGTVVTVSHAGTNLQTVTNHGLARLDSGVSRRFWRLTRRYGWHGLAWLEALLRLSDQRRSEWEQQHGGEA